MKINLIFLLILFGLNSSMFSQKSLEIEVLESKYWNGKSKLNLVLQIKNPTSDTLIIFQPNLGQFSNHFSLRKNFTINGQKNKAYRLVITKEGECSEEEGGMRPPGQAPTIKYASKSDVIVLPPGQKSKEIRVNLNLIDTWFCHEAEYFCRIEYEPMINLLTKKQTKKILEKDKTLTEIITETNEFIKTESLSRETIPTWTLLTKKIINGNKTLNRVTQIKGQSNKIKLNKN